MVVFALYLLDTSSSVGLPKLDMGFILRSVAFALLFIPFRSLAQRSNRWIVPGAIWHDTDGNVIHAHAGGIIKQNGAISVLLMTEVLTFNKSTITVLQTLFIGLDKMKSPVERFSAVYSRPFAPGFNVHI